MPSFARRPSICGGEKPPVTAAITSSQMPFRRSQQLTMSPIASYSGRSWFLMSSGHFDISHCTERMPASKSQPEPTRGCEFEPRSILGSAPKNSAASSFEASRYESSPALLCLRVTTLPPWVVL